MTSFLARLRMMFAVLFNRPVKVRLPKPFGGATLFPDDGLVLPAMTGADDGDGDGDGSGDGDGAGEGEGEGDGDGGDGEGDGKPSGDGDGDGDGDGEEKGKDDDWKWQARKHERRSKAEKKKREEAEAKLKKREEADKSEQEKAVDKAREEGRTSALTEAEKERRSDRLEVAVTRLANKPIEIGEGDDKKKVRFADSDDALVFIERAIDRGDIDADEIFDDNNRVKADALKGELAELLETKPHYQAASGEGGEQKKKPKAASGDADQGRGEGSGSKSLEEMSPEDHLKRIQKKS